MITLIAESKTMSSSLDPISEAEMQSHRPLFEDDARKIMEFVRSNDVEELAMRLKVSIPMASKALRLAYDFTDQSHGRQAITEFTGEVFRALDVATLLPADLKYASGRVFIISSLYGMLRSDDFIRPYRLDFSSDCDPEGKKLSDYWKKKNTIALAKLIKESQQTEILNLLPGEAIKCIDFKLLKRFAHVMKPDFKMLGESCTVKTPHTGRLKELRGLMLRRILSNRIDNFDDLLNIEDSQFILDPENSKTGYPLFLCTP